MQTKRKSDGEDGSLIKIRTAQKVPWMRIPPTMGKVGFYGLLIHLLLVSVVNCQWDDTGTALSPAESECDGIYLSYAFGYREKELPHVKNASAQAYAFTAAATILNAGSEELKSWKMFIGFQHNEILVSTGQAVLADGSEFPAHVGNGTYLMGFPQTDLKTSIDTAGDYNQIQMEIEIKGTQFGVRPPSIPMPSTIRLANDGYKCPAPTRHRSEMHVCCKRDLKFKTKHIEGKFLPRQNGDLTIMYDVLQAYQGKYTAQVSMSNNNPLGRLDNWNLTWEWMRGEFIYSMKGAYTLRKDITDCIYGSTVNYYQGLDFTPVMNCQKKPVIVDLPPERKDDPIIGQIPNCCRNGTLLPSTMDPSKSQAAFQLQVFKIPPDMNRTTLYPPQNWKINGVLNPDYKCGPPIRVSPTLFPDTSGLMSQTPAVASWQIVCNITRPKKTTSRCCVSFSAYYNDSVVPCNTCACGCPEDTNPICNPNASPLLLPYEALLVPFDNRTVKAKAWAKIKHNHVPNPLPCGDNCGVSINWHVYSDYRKGWTARITLFNWEQYNFADWFVAVEMKEAILGFEKMYSFNGTRIEGRNDTLFIQGLTGLNYLIREVNGTNPETDPPIPGKQQSVISFNKRQAPHLHVAAGDGFPTRVYFNGEECSLPTEFPKSACHLSAVNMLSLILLTTVIYVLSMHQL